MSLTSVAFKDPFVREYARRIQMGEVQPPAQLAGMFAGNGYFDPSQMDSLYAAINQFDPQGAASVRFRVGDVRDASTAGLGANDTLSWQSAKDENDLSPALRMLALPFAVQSAASLFSGAGGAAGASGLDISGGLDMPGVADASWGVNPQAVGSDALLNNAADTFDSTLGADALSNSGQTYQQFLNSVGSGVGTGAAATLGAKAAAGAAGSAAASAIGPGNGGIDDGALSKILNEAAPGAGAGLLSNLAAQLGLSSGDLLKMAGSAVPGLMGAYASSKQADTLEGLAKEYSAYGAPSRARYEASFAPGFTMAQDPGYQDALDASSKATMRSMSVNGNPAGSPNAWAATMKDTYDRTAYPALQQYRNQNSSTSGIGNFNAAAPGMQTGQVQANANIWNGIGSAIGNVTNPAPTLADIMKQYGSGNIFKVA